MPAMKTRAKRAIPITNPYPTIGGIPKVSVYEKSREERIKENLQRMQNLGIMDLSLKLKSETRPAKRQYNLNPGRKSPRETPPLQLSVSTRRSSRLKNATPVSYAEEGEVKKGKSSNVLTVWFGKGERPEVYTEEHEKLLGSTVREWDLFVDGYDKDGKRIYDPVRGKSCHQCRQKTLGYRTQCSQYHPSGQGQFCGDCLYMRYGEHVLETLENPDWICPGCRGICNCSLCRKRKGWLPTGAAYKKIRKMGYKSVAHYLIKTNNESKTSVDDETNAAEDSQASATRSLSFKEAKEYSEEDHLVLMVTDGLQDDNRNDDDDDDDDGINKNQDSARKALYGHIQTSVIDVHELSDHKALAVDKMDIATPVIIDAEAQGNETKRMADSANKGSQGTRTKLKIVVEPNPDSIGGRLRQRRKSQA